MADGTKAAGTTYPSTSYIRERRFAVVMYGGVSLAVYIAGVAREMLNLVRATAPAPSNEERRNEKGRAGLAEQDLRSSERIYRRLAQHVHGQPLFENGPNGERQLTGKPDADLLERYVIDVISGTSAGGINGIFLAKALATDREIDPISDLWIDEGDLRELLNDADSTRGMSLRPQEPPVSLLNGERMYKSLVAAFDRMDELERQPRFDPGDRLDLFVTATDVHGELIQLTLANGVAREKRHRQGFHFRWLDNQRGDFAKTQNPLLAFAARCTSSFPVAFEPFTWKDACRLEARAGGMSDWKDCLLYEGDNYEERPFTDGGYLDNKPFSYAVDQLSNRQSYLETIRRLVYVEPDPERIDPQDFAQRQTRKPDALDNALAGLIGVPGYETIREDLERVVARGVRIDALRDIEELVAARLIEGQLKVPYLEPGKWTQEAAYERMVRSFGVGYVAYHRVKVNALIDELVEVICGAARVRRIERAGVVRDVVRDWIDANYSSLARQMDLLLQADVDYRRRKLAFVIRKALDLELGDGTVDLDALRDRLRSAYQRLDELKLRSRTKVAELVTELREGPLADVELEAVVSQAEPAKRRKALDDLFEKLALAPKSQGLLDYLENDLGPEVKKASDLAAEALGISPRRDEAPPLKPTTDLDKLRCFYSLYEAFDMVIYPLAQQGELGEPERVEVLRISPHDSRVPADTKQRAEKLRGTRLGHFGAFLEPEWRRNDILWGRLDTAEILIRELLRDAGPAVAESEIAEVVGMAQAAIVEEVLGPQLSVRLAANATRRRASLSEEAMGEVAKVLGDRTRLYEFFVKHQGGYDLEMDRERQLDNAARASRILERILAGTAAARDRGFPKQVRWALTAFAAVVEMAVPKRGWGYAYAHWLKLAAFFSLAMVVVGLALGFPPATVFGGKVFAFCAVLWVAKRAIRAWAREELEPAAALASLAGGAVVLAALAVGVLVLGGGDLGRRAIRLWSGMAPATEDFFLGGTLVGLLAGELGLGLARRVEDTWRGIATRLGHGLGVLGRRARSGLERLRRRPPAVAAGREPVNP